MSTRREFNKALIIGGVGAAIAPMSLIEPSYIDLAWQNVDKLAHLVSTTQFWGDGRVITMFDYEDGHSEVIRDVPNPFQDGKPPFKIIEGGK